MGSAGRARCGLTCFRNRLFRSDLAAEPHRNVCRRLLFDKLDGKSREPLQAAVDLDPGSAVPDQRSCIADKVVGYIEAVFGDPLLRKLPVRVGNLFQRYFVEIRLVFFSRLTEDGGNPADSVGNGYLN